ncbi:MAG TPA: HPF/RaiA family ribosome-associated protein [Candidatus Methylacidiphilales bacterium]
MTTLPSTSLPWNIVTRNLHGHEQLHKKILEKIGKLERHLKHFPPGTVYLHIALDRNTKKDFFTAALTLRVPSHILHSEKSAPDVIKAFDDAIRALLRELENLKSDLRHEKLWKRKGRREELRELKAAAFAEEPLPEGTGPQKFEDVVREFLRQQYDSLLHHIERRIRDDELAGDLQPGALDARDIADEVVRQAETRAGEKPEKMYWAVWFYQLAHQELLAHRRALSQTAADVSLDEVQRPPNEGDEAEGYDAEHPLEIIEEELEPSAVTTEATVPDPHAFPPDQVFGGKDLLEQVQPAVKNWPQSERELFEFYFIENLDPQDIADITGQPTAKVQETLLSVQKRLRETIHEKTSP